ncbi:Catechol 1,2-dioxygenase 2 [Enhygromyxa salina]|uniref:Catechol 1,2-dioxygenase 2 n=1 Tax=Enhygromyxa salina TaxID=215803 RepID=A0A2S9YGD8_9BACT|nr:hypothetical protein [Enhygromyxa salina]PRQ04101.1 Catechol 1,2-dioxygenase 2 [Enhygromyxa salina]
MPGDVITRRGFMGLTLGAASTALTACARDSDPMTSVDAILAGTCEPPPPDGTCTVTAQDIEGPYYLPASPERSELDTVGDEGVALALSGVVTDASCTPLLDTIVEVWHADPSGAYDNSPTMNYRGWVRTGVEGIYAFTTLVPGRYLNGDTLRPSHIHFKVWRDGAPVLTSQIYFADDPQLDDDPWAEPARTVCLERDGEGVSAVFDITLA